MSIFIDCTYTRLQDGNVGITRVVRSLIRELLENPMYFEQAIPICFGRKKFRVVLPHLLNPGEKSYEEASTQSAGPLMALFRRFTSGRLRARIVNSLPLLVQRILWEAFSSLTFSHIARRLPIADIGPGDVVLLADASWNYRVWQCARIARAAGAHVVTMVHDLIPINHPEFVAPLFSKVFRNWFLHMLDCSSALICNSQATRDEVVNFCKQAQIQHPPIGFFHLGSNIGVPNTEQAKVRPEIKTLASLAEIGRNLFLTVGTIERRKRHDFLLDAFAQVWRHHPDATLVIAGRPGGEAENTIRRIEEHPLLGKNLFWYADASDDEIHCLYNAADALVFCSAAEGFGLPLMEARHLGCTVVASDIPAFRELADEGVKLFPTDNIEALAETVCALISAGCHIPPPLMRTPIRWSESTAALAEQITRLVTLKPIAA